MLIVIVLGYAFDDYDHFDAYEDFEDPNDTHDREQNELDRVFDYDPFDDLEEVAEPDAFYDWDTEYYNDLDDSPCEAVHGGSCRAAVGKVKHSAWVFKRFSPIKHAANRAFRRTWNHHLKANDFEFIPDTRFGQHG